jgi:hypothetical protein
MYFESIATHGSLSTPRTLASLTVFRRFRESPQFGPARFVALKMLNRKDLTGTLRFLDREVLFQSGILSVIDILIRRRPRLIVFGVIPHEFLTFLVAEVAKHMGIEVLAFLPSQFAPTMIPVSSSRGKFVPSGAAVSRSRVRDELMTMSRRGLAALVANESPKYIDIQKASDQKQRRPIQTYHVMRHVVAWLRAGRYPESIDFSGHADSRFLGKVGLLLKILLTRSLQTSLRLKIDRLGGTSLPLSPRFALFALTYEPERNALPGGLPFDFQGDAVVLAREIVPPNVQLVVKEHSSQQTSALRGFLGRSPLFYEAIASLPATVFSETASRLVDTLSQAEAVFTLTGTVAIEAAIRGVPVAYFGSPWWEGLPGSLKMEGVKSYDEILAVTLPSLREVEAFFDDLAGNRMIPGVAAESAATIEKRYGTVPDALWQAEASAISACIREILEW